MSDPGRVGGPAGSAPAGRKIGNTRDRGVQLKEASEAGDTSILGIVGCSTKNLPCPVVVIVGYEQYRKGSVEDEARGECGDVDGLGEGPRGCSKVVLMRVHAGC